MRFFLVEAKQIFSAKLLFEQVCPTLSPSLFIAVTLFSFGLKLNNILCRQLHKQKHFLFSSESFTYSFDFRCRLLVLKICCCVILQSFFLQVCSSFYIFICLSICDNFGLYVYYFFNFLARSFRSIILLLWTNCSLSREKVQKDYFTLCQRRLV